MSNIQVFNFNELQVRTVVKDGDPWFVGKDVAEILGYSNTGKAVQMHVDEDEKADFPIWDGRQNRNQKIINESGLYSLILSSELPNAKVFKKWVTKEVLPSIRQHGGYIAVNEEDKDEDILARAVLLAHKQIEKKNQRIQEQQHKLEEQQPKVHFAELCMQSSQTMKVADVARMLASKGYSIGQNRLFNKLRDWGLLHKNGTEPINRYIEQGLFEVAQGVKAKASGESFVWRTTYVTAKGQQYIVDRLNKKQSN